MATLKVEVKNGKIVWHNHTYVPDATDTYVLGNGWHVWLDHKRGKIICHAEREYSTGTAKCHREFNLADGLVGLSGGDVRTRYAYFRSTMFQDFLDDTGVDTVKRQDPNGDYTGYSAYPDAYIEIKTDGEASYSLRQDSIYDTAYWKTWTIAGATWVIVHTHNYCRDHRNDNVSLYTLTKDATLLRDQIKAAEYQR